MNTLSLLLTCLSAPAPAADLLAIPHPSRLPALPPVQEPSAEREEPAPVEPVTVEGLQPLHRVGTLLLGGQPTLEAFQELAQQDVTLVIDLRMPQEERGFDEALLLEELGMRYEHLGFGGGKPLTDDIFDTVRDLLAEHRESGAGQALLHCASSNRVGAVWASARVLDEGVPWDTAVAEARRAGLRSPALEDAARHYVVGAGNQELGVFKLKLREEHPDVARISAGELEVRLARPGAAPLLIDVRQPAEYEVSHLRGAERAATPAEARELLGDGSRDREIIVYCSVGKRSAELAEALGAAGYTNVKNLEGSIFEWANTGRPLYRGAEPARYVHPFDETWGRLLDAGLHPPAADGGTPGK